MGLGLQLGMQWSTGQKDNTVTSLVNLQSNIQMSRPYKAVVESGWWITSHYITRTIGPHGPEFVEEHLNLNWLALSKADVMATNPVHVTLSATLLCLVILPQSSLSVLYFIYIVYGFSDGKPPWSCSICSKTSEIIMAIFENKIELYCPSI